MPADLHQIARRDALPAVVGRHTVTDLLGPNQPPVLQVGPSDRQTVQKPPAVAALRVALRLLETLELTLAPPNLSPEPPGSD
ncbi:hypothetical protein GCM10023317_85020 [Actinopolymorpha pittospori]